MDKLHVRLTFHFFHYQYCILAVQICVNANLNYMSLSKWQKVYLLLVIVYVVYKQLSSIFIKDFKEFASFLYEKLSRYCSNLRISYFVLSIFIIRVFHWKLIFLESESHFVFLPSGGAIKRVVNFLNHIIFITKLKMLQFNAELLLSN